MKPMDWQAHKIIWALAGRTMAAVNTSADGFGDGLLGWISLAKASLSALVAAMRGEVIPTNNGGRSLDYVTRKAGKVWRICFSLCLGVSVANQDRLAAVLGRLGDRGCRR